MLVEQIWTNSALRNFNYLIACPESGTALAIDPIDHQHCLNVASERGWHITQVFNTHEHHDHIAGNSHIIKATGAKLLAHHAANRAIPGIDIGLHGGDIVKVGTTIKLEALDTPGHTMCHICLLSHTDTPALFCGDTLLTAGIGNCYHGGDPTVLYQTLVDQLSVLADDTLLYSGHDMIEQNLKFTLDCEPENTVAAQLLIDIHPHNPNNALITSIALEKQINTFFRLQNPHIITRLRHRYPNLPIDPDSKAVFLKLRQLRNDW